MEIIRGLHNLRGAHRGCVLTIGNFDGVHRGHQAVLAQLKALARAQQLPATVVSFEPTPREFFCPAEAPVRLAGLREKAVDLAAAGADRLLCLRFNRAFAQWPPQRFVEALLVDGLGARAVMVGEDFRYGHERAGDAASLAAAGRKHGFEVAPLPIVKVGGERISSTRVRAALAAGDTDLATALLGRPYRVCGRVVPGARLGRSLDVPTANLRIGARPAPRFGVYAVQVRVAGEGGAVHQGAANLGVRPAVGGGECLLEVHLLDFDGDLYGRRLEVWFRDYLRPEASFDSNAALRAQMLADIQRTRILLARHPSPCPNP